MPVSLIDSHIDALMLVADGSFASCPTVVIMSGSALLFLKQGSLVDVHYFFESFLINHLLNAVFFVIKTLKILIIQLIFHSIDKRFAKINYRKLNQTDYFFIELVITSQQKGGVTKRDLYLHKFGT